MWVMMDYRFLENKQADYLNEVATKLGVNSPFKKAIVDPSADNFRNIVMPI
jgi:hypothetical protein